MLPDVNHNSMNNKKCNGKYFVPRSCIWALKWTNISFQVNEKGLKNKEKSITKVGK